MQKKNKLWESILKSREKSRPQTKEVIDNVFDEFIELAGDRAFADDKAIIGGIGIIGRVSFTVVGQQKGRGIQEIQKTRNGMCLPEGYRKSLRLMKQAEKFGRPIVCLVDTPAAYSGIESEERGISKAIATNLMEMSQLEVPIVTIILSQGGSGGALALSVANEIWSLENSYFSILAPEGFSTILWKDSSRAKEAAEIMKSTPSELLKTNFTDKIIKEPKEGIATNPNFVYRQIRENLIKFAAKNKPGYSNVKKRNKKFNSIKPYK